MKIKAFTLTEITISLAIIGIICIIVLKNLNTIDFREKLNIAKAYKAIEVFDQASDDIRNMDKEHCPLSAFMYKSGVNSSGEQEYEVALVLPETGKSQAVLDIYGEFVKYETTGLDFCDYSPYCENYNENKESDEEKIHSGDIPAVKIAGDIYIGVKVDDTIGDCPDYNLPEQDETINVRNEFGKNSKPKCWAKMYVDVNGPDEPNEDGKDIFVFGFDNEGIHH